MAVTRLIFQLGTNNWQTPEEPAPGSGILHEAHHLCYNAMPGTACYSVYPSAVHGSNPGRSNCRVVKLPHKIPICESISPVSDKRWHSMSDAEVEGYLKRCEDATYAEMARGETETGAEYTWAVAHHTFMNGIVLKRVIQRRVAEGKQSTPIVVFCHGTALKMYSNEKKGLPDYPTRFKPMMDREGIFTDLSTGARAVITISEANKQHFLEIFPDFPAERIHVSLNGYNPLVFYPQKDLTLAACLSSYQTEPYRGEPQRIPGDAFGRMVLFVGKFADWKRLDAVLKAAAKYEAQYPDVATVIVGTGQPSDIELYQDMAFETLKLKRTFFLGAKMQPDLCKLASVANVGVFPSYKEPFGMVFIECMACGTPVIGAKSGGPLQFVDDTVGTLVPENDDKDAFSDSVCAAISKALDENWKASKGPACLKKTEAFSMNQQCEEIVQALDGMTGGALTDSYMSMVKFPTAATFDLDDACTQIQMAKRRCERARKEVSESRIPITRLSEGLRTGLDRWVRRARTATNGPAGSVPDEEEAGSEPSDEAMRRPIRQKTRTLLDIGALQLQQSVQGETQSPGEGEAKSIETTKRIAVQQSMQTQTTAGLEATARLSADGGRMMAASGVPAKGYYCQAARVLFAPISRMCRRCRSAAGAGGEPASATRSACDIA